jgi:hypothetical protein
MRSGSAVRTVEGKSLDLRRMKLMKVGHGASWRDEYRKIEIEEEFYLILRSDGKSDSV